MFLAQALLMTTQALAFICFSLNIQDN